MLVRVETLKKRRKEKGQTQDDEIKK